MSISVLEAGLSDAETLRNLGELYTYDFSEILLLDLNGAVRFEHDFWDGCWGGDRTPYLIRVAGCLAGFAIVARGSRISGDPAVHDVAEFFVVRRYRRQGIGTSAAAELFRTRTGTWEVRERAENAAARAFWRKAIGAYSGECFEEMSIADERWQGWVQRFVS